MNAGLKSLQQSNGLFWKIFGAKSRECDPVMGYPFQGNRPNNRSAYCLQIEKKETLALTYKLEKL